MEDDIPPPSVTDSQAPSMSTDMVDIPDMPSVHGGDNADANGDDDDDCIVVTSRAPLPSRSMVFDGVEVPALPARSKKKQADLPVIYEMMVSVFSPFVCLADFLVLLGHQVQ